MPESITRAISSPCCSKTWRAQRFITKLIFRFLVNTILSPSTGFWRRMHYQAFNFVLRFAVQHVCDNILAWKRAHLLDIRLGDSIGSRPRVDLVRMNAVVLVESKCMRACRLLSTTTRKSTSVIAKATNTLIWVNGKSTTRIWHAWRDLNYRGLRVVSVEARLRINHKLKCRPCRAQVRGDITKRASMLASYVDQQKNTHMQQRHVATRPCLKGKLWPAHSMAKMERLNQSTCNFTKPFSALTAPGISWIFTAYAHLVLAFHSVSVLTSTSILCRLGVGR